MFHTNPILKNENSTVWIDSCVEVDMINNVKNVIKEESFSSNVNEEDKIMKILEKRKEQFDGNYEKKWYDNRSGRYVKQNQCENFITYLKKM